ncbi:MAG: DPP IV N-terminal domain-containing protein, partial [Candidatus Vogelbacteria bacterium]|nr:DPP IV N-terminal domain-containing protein [Candidatus Vogelbacteria bacterium]
MFKLDIRFFCLALLFGLILIPSQSVFGAELKYAKILNVQNREVLVQFGGLENSNNYLCNTSSLGCRNLGASTPQEISNYFNEKETPLSEKISDIKFDRSKATRLTLSLHQKFLAYYEPATIGKTTDRSHVLLDLRTATPKKYSLSSKTVYWDLLTEELRLFDFSPNEKRLLYLDDKDNYPTLYLVNLNPLSKQPLPGTKLFSKNYSVADFQFLDDDNIVFVANRDNPYRFSLYKFNIITKNLIKIADDISYSQRVKKEGGNLVFLQIKNNSVIPVIYNLPSGKLKYFTDIPANPPKDKEVVSELFSTGNLKGVILRSSKFAKSTRQPLLIWLHGGPYREASWLYHPYLSYAVYDWMLNDLVKSGVTVLKLDYRGSYGFGRTFAESITKNVGKG